MATVVLLTAMSPPQLLYNWLPASFAEFSPTVESRTSNAQLYEPDAGPPKNRPPPNSPAEFRDTTVASSTSCPEPKYAMPPPLHVLQLAMFPAMVLCATVTVTP